MKRYTVHGDKDKEEMIVYLFFCIVYRVPCTVSFLRLCVYFAERRDVFKAFSLRLDKGGNVLRKGDVFKASFLRLDKGKNVLRQGDVFKAFSLRLDKGENVLRKGDVFKAFSLRLDKGKKHSAKYA